VAANAPVIRLRDVVFLHHVGFLKKAKSGLSNPSGLGRRILARDAAALTAKAVSTRM
jgi:hypothetical protein